MVVLWLCRECLFLVEILTKVFRGDGVLLAWQLTLKWFKKKVLCTITAFSHLHIGLFQYEKHMYIKKG